MQLRFFIAMAIGKYLGLNKFLSIQLTTSHRTQCVSVTQTSRLNMLREIIVVRP